MPALRVTATSNTNEGSRVSQGSSQMSYCSACRRRGPWDSAGDTGGSAECDVASREEALLFKLLAERCRARVCGAAVRMEAPGRSTFSPREAQELALALRARFPLGVVVAHLLMRGCVVLGAHRRLVCLKCAIKLLRSGLAVGLAITGAGACALRVGRRKAPLRALLR